MKTKWCRQTGLCIHYEVLPPSVKNGDIVEFSARNIHEPSGEPTAYGGIKGIVVNLGFNGFNIEAETCTLVVLDRYFKNHHGRIGISEGVWLIKDEVEFFYRFNSFVAGNEIVKFK